jgi:NAD(P)-dependent dehydrogenase (short-subunit alcohol dehydrogenase family)
MVMRFANKVILVTGGTSGIGLATAKRLTAEGAKVALTGLNPEHLKDTQAALPAALVIENDATDPAAAAALAQRLAQEFGQIDGAFLNAGFGEFAKLAEISADTFDRHAALNLRAPMLQAQALSPLLRDGGALLLIGSATVGGTRADALIYASMKAGVRQAGRALATEFAPRGIRVNLVTPGATETNFHSRGGMGAEDLKAYKERVSKLVPLHRLGQPEDVAAAACFLLSDEAGYITGTELRVDGGLTMA